MLRNKLAEIENILFFWGVKTSNLGSRPEIENQAFQNSCSNPN